MLSVSCIVHVDSRSEVTDRGQADSQGLVAGGDAGSRNNRMVLLWGSVVDAVGRSRDTSTPDGV